MYYPVRVRTISALVCLLVGWQCPPLPAGEVFRNENISLKSTTYTLKQGNTVARVVPGIGSNVFSIEHMGTEYLQPLTWVDEFSNWWGGVPVLYPTPNRVRNGRLTFDGREVAFKPNFGDHHIHGLVFDRPWDVVETGTTDSSAFITVAMKFDSSSAHLGQFPFPHRLEMKIEVGEGLTSWTFTVDNSAGQAPVPFGFGLHPIFQYQGSRDQTWVTLPVTHKMEAVEALPTGKLVPAADLDYPLNQPLTLQGRSFDDVFLGLTPDQPVTLEFRDKERGITISASEAFSHLVLWSPDFPFFSIEHQTSSTDAHNLHAAGFVQEASLQVCPPGERCSGFVEYRFSGGSSYDWVWEDRSFQLSEKHCKSCHGIAFSGARAASLWGRKWQHAQGDQDLSRVIREGLPDLGMPGFSETLDKEEIENLAVFMVRLLKTTPQKMTKLLLENSHTGPRVSSKETFRLETVTGVKGTPWSMAFLPGGNILFTEREGHVRLLEKGMVSPPVEGTPSVAVRQDAGMLALALDPDYHNTGWIYLAFADPGEKPMTSMLRVVRGRIKGNLWQDQEDIWHTPQDFYSENNSHYGTRFLFRGDHLFFSLGDRGRRDLAQDLSSPFGKIHRINRDGTVPADNPFLDNPAAWPTVWSYGHRNPQGLTMERSGAIWSTEHGPKGGDELNLILRGANFGWPRATHGLDDDGQVISERASLPGMENPVLAWKDGIAPSNLGFYQGKSFPHWKGDLFVGSLGGQELRRLTIVDRKVQSQELLLKSVGRIRDIQPGPDGHIYLAIERPGGHSAIARLVPEQP